MPVHPANSQKQRMSASLAPRQEFALIGPPRPNDTELWQRYRRSSHGSAAENELIEQYLPLVRTVVGRLAMNLPSHVCVEDLCSVGMVGLLSAVRQFDPSINPVFESYARLRIRGAVLDELRRMDWAPRSVHLKARRV